MLGKFQTKQLCVKLYKYLETWIWKFIAQKTDNTIQETLIEISWEKQQNFIIWTDIAMDITDITDRGKNNIHPLL